MQRQRLTGVHLYCEESLMGLKSCECACCVSDAATGNLTYCTVLRYRQNDCSIGIGICTNSVDHRILPANCGEIGQ